MLHSRERELVSNHIPSLISNDNLHDDDDDDDDDTDDDDTDDCDDDDDDDEKW
jgi:hypothetical protein